VGGRKPPVPKEPRQHGSDNAEKNYGTDIATLVRMIEAGEL
jgi:hypothetical protein